MRGLGYDKFSDLTAEFAIKGDFADYGVRVDKQLTALVEVKRVTTKLGAKHLRQIEDYGVREGVEWLVLTNGAHWQVHLENQIDHRMLRVAGRSGGLRVHLRWRH